MNEKIINEQEENISVMGFLDYNAYQISCVLGVDQEDVEKELKNKKSKLSSLLDKGRVAANFMIDKKLMNMAMGGDTKALSELERRKKIRTGP